MEYRNTDVWGFKHAIRSLINMGEIKESDSGICRGGDYGIGCNNCAAFDKCFHEFNHSFQLGKRDLTKMQELITDDRKAFLNMIHVSIDIVKGKITSASDLRLVREEEITTIDTTYLDIRDDFFHGDSMGYVEFCRWIRTLPYAEELIMYEGESK